MAAIRLARTEDLVHLGMLESRAAQRYREVGLVAIADGPTLPETMLAAACATRRLFVAIDSNDLPIGMLLWSVTDGELHIEELSVDPDHQGAGIGTALLERVAEQARRLGFPSVSLRTFRDVAWNAPYYARRGYVEVPELSLGPEMWRKIGQEEAAGFDVRRRTTMRLGLPPTRR